MARPTNRLSAGTLKRKLAPGLYADGGGLYLQVSEQHTLAWIFRFTRAGRPRKMGLGPVSVKPGDKRITIADARQKAATARSLLVDGIDPIEERNARMAAQAAESAKSVTFKEAATRYIAAHRAGWKSPKHAGQWTATLETYAYPTLGTLDVSAIETAHVLRVIEPIWSTKTETASRVRGRVESILDWAKARGLRNGENPARWRGHLDQLLPAKSQVSPVENFPALPYSQIPDFMAKLRAKQGSSARALEFTILTVARTGDTIGATRSEINESERLWTVPAGRVKGKKGARKRDHVVPLTDAALAAMKAAQPAGSNVRRLRSLPDQGFLFPGGVAGACLSNAAMSELLKGMGYSPDIATVHGFRSTFKDWCGDQTSYPNEMSEIAMAHTVPDKVEAAYRRSDMRARRRQMMEDWASYCGGGQQQNVLAS